MAKASDNPFPSVLLVEQASAPTTPASGQARLYRGTDNKLYIKDDAGAATEVGAGAGAPGTWTSYTPVVTGATTNPVLGTGSIAEGRYIENGSIVTCWFGIQFGTSGMSGGSGEIRISLPVNMLTTGTTVPIGSGSGFNPTVSYSILRQSTSTMKFWIPTTASYLTGTTSLWGGAGSQIWGRITYEKA
jgi:hypothetical protein